MLVCVIQYSIGGPGTDVGLRGGFQTVYNASTTTTLVNCQFSQDVIVNGTVTWAADYSVNADLVVISSARGS